MEGCLREIYNYIIYYNSNWSGVNLEYEVLSDDRTEGYKEVNNIEMTKTKCNNYYRTEISLMLCDYLGQPGVYVINNGKVEYLGLTD